MEYTAEDYDILYGTDELLEIEEVELLAETAEILI